MKRGEDSTCLLSARTGHSQCHMVR
jgi:hypothetical protein